MRAERKSGSSTTRIGIDRRLRLEWLERTAQMVLAGMTAPDVRAALERELRPAFRCQDSASNRSLSATIGVLLRIWVHTPERLLPLRDEGLNFVAALAPSEHLAVHWGMTMAVYPFWGAVATQVGRLLRLQKMMAARQVQQRLREQFGERETVSRAGRRVLRSYVAWGVLNDTETKGVYTLAKPRPVTDLKLVAWLGEAVLLGSPINGFVSLRELVAHPALFPFSLKAATGAQLAEASPRLGLVRHGLDEELIFLERPG